MKPAVKPITSQECLAKNQSAHLGIVVEGKVADGVSIGASAGGECGDGCTEVALVFVDEGREDLDVLETGVHALSVEGDHCMNSIAKQQHLVLVIVLAHLENNVSIYTSTSIRWYFDGDKRAGWVLEKVVKQVFPSDQFKCLREVIIKEIKYLLPGSDLLQLFKWIKQSNRKRVILIKPVVRHIN